MPAERILLVDDEQEFLRPLSKRLVMRGFRVSTAECGAEALALLDHESFGAVVLDLVMPDMDGLETLRQIMQKNPSQQVILLTGKGTGVHESEALKLGALDFLRKPVDMDVLVERLKTNNLQKLKQRILRRVAVNLKKSGFDAAPYVRDLVPMEQFCQFYAFYGLTHHHPLYFAFSNSGLAGSYFLGKCIVEHSLVYKSDVRGDELKTKGQVYAVDGMQIPLHKDEMIHIIDSYLIKALVHNYSHDPENLETFTIRNTIALPYANIHGAPMEGCFLGPFATVDLTAVHDCVVGEYAYVQTKELAHATVPAGLVWIKSGDVFEFKYQHDPKLLAKYISMPPGEQPKGLFMDFEEERQDAFQPCFDQVCLAHELDVPTWSALSPYAVAKGECALGENVIVCQRAYLENAKLGRGANAQEHCSIIDSELQGLNITAHGGILINCRMGEKVFVAFNSFLRGLKEAPLKVGSGCMVMPHTIIDLEEPLEIPQRHVVWGFIRNKADLAGHSIAIEKLRAVQGQVSMGAMTFTGDGEALVSAFEHRIEHILEANGAYFDGEKGLGHAQKNQAMSFNTIQPYAEGPFKGLYPTIEIRPIEP
ncbi:MAG TPA: response regulator [Desulfonatronum sp.]|nr:response regulator [Desulfonatronum sp.]